jgi:hypothetical protein
MPNHDDASKPATPASAAVGRSGSRQALLGGDRERRSLPALMCGNTVGGLSTTPSI